MPALFQSPPANAGWLSHMPNPNTETSAMSFRIVTLLYSSVANLRCWCRCDVVVVILSIIEVLRHDSPLFVQLTPSTLYTSNRVLKNLPFTLRQAQGERRQACNRWRFSVRAEPVEARIRLFPQPAKGSI